MPGHAFELEYGLAGAGGLRPPFLSVAFRAFVALFFFLLGVCLSEVAMAADGTWLPLKGDGVHDPRSPAVKELLEPAQALGELASAAPDPYIGNQVRWVHAIEKGLISPRAQLHPDTRIQVLDLDVFLGVGGSMPVVRFPHRAHTYWLDCSNCHEHLFKAKAGGNSISMYQILQGEQCGVCHGAVAFPLTECARCHSVPQRDFASRLQDPAVRRVPGTKAAVFAPTKPERAP